MSYFPNDFLLGAATAAHQVEKTWLKLIPLIIYTPNTVRGCIP
jgi:hypothetical protein